VLYNIGAVDFVPFSWWWAWWCPKHVDTPINTSSSATSWLFIHLHLHAVWSTSALFQAFSAVKQECDTIHWSSWRLILKELEYLETLVTGRERATSKKNWIQLRFWSSRHVVKSLTIRLSVNKLLGYRYSQCLQTWW
jgi:hypothetical protein